MNRSILTIAMLVALVGAACGGSETELSTTSAAPAASATTAAAPTSAAPPTTAIAAAPATTTTTTAALSDQGCADVIDGAVRATGATFTVDATVSSADTGWEKYADRWEVRTIDGEVLGVRELTHPHENEQPFTRSLEGLEIPDGVEQVVLVAHDLMAGFCGAAFTVGVER